MKFPLRLTNHIKINTLYFQMPLFFAVIIGILYFPAVFLTTGNVPLISKTRFTKGLKAIKRSGFDYLKIPELCFGLLTISFIVLILLDSIFAELELPIAGVFLAITVG